MAQNNGYASLVAQRARKKTKRRTLDDYETPGDVTERLLRHVDLTGPILEPACGSGRICSVLRRAGFITIGHDIKGGHDFLARSELWPGDVVSNPPYRDGLAEAFVRKALHLASGRVCMLLEGKFLWGEKRAVRLFADDTPDKVILIPDRIYFYEGPLGDQLESQFFSHCWVCWPDRSKRRLARHVCETTWASRGGVFG